MNVKSILITVPSEVILRKITTVPSLKNLTRTKLKVGENTERVNHFQFAQIMRMLTIAGCDVKEIK